MAAEPKTILVIEDDPEFRQLAVHILKRAGYRVHTAENGSRGLEEARRLVPDLILLDIEMPVMDGYAVCQAIRSDPAVGRVPIVLVTVHSKVRQIAEGLRLGADDHVTKPFDPADLLLRVESALRGRSPEA